MSTRQLGFKLVTIGNDKTLSEIDKINKKMDELSSKIKAIQKTPIKLSTAFDTKGLNELLKVLDKVDKTKLNPAIVSTIKELKAQLGLLEKQVGTTQEKLNKISTPQLTDVEINKINGSFVQLNGSAAKVMETISKLRPSIANIDDESIRNTYDSLDKVYARLKTLKEEKKAILFDKNTSEVETASALAPLIKEQQLLTIQKKELEAQSKKTAQALLQEGKNIPIDSTVGMRLELNKLIKEYENLSKAEKQAANGQELKKKVIDLSAEVSKEEQSIGNFRRNVGNYQSALAGLLPQLESLQREGLFAGQSLENIFKADLIAKEQQLRAEIQKLGDEFKELGTDIQNAWQRANLLGQIDDKVRELGSVRGTLDQTGNSLTRLGGKLASISDIVTGGLIGGGIVATLGALTGFARGSLQEFTQAETALAKINQQLKITGNSSGQSAEGLQEMAKELEVLTGIDGDQILNDITSGLLKFTRIQGQVFQDAQKAALDLSTVLGGDLSGATQLLGKALENPIKGITQLQKAGISLDASAQKQIKQAVQQNDIYKAQSIILQEVNKRFGGLATAVNQTDLQGIRKLTVDFNNFKEAVGKGLIAATNTIIKFFSDVSLGVDVFSESTRTLERGLKTLEETAIKEVASIKGVVEALKDETLSREGRDALISELITKYPDLIDQYDLEYASIDRLNEIQQELTTTVLKQVGERIKAQTKEALITEQVNKSIEIAYLKAGRLSAGQKFAAGITGTNQQQAVQKFIAQKESEIKSLQSQINDIDKTFEEYDKTIAKAIGLPLTEASFTSAEKLNTRIKAVIGETAEVLNNDKASQAAKNYAAKLNAEFKAVQKELNAGDLSETRRQELINKAAAGLQELARLSAKRIITAADTTEEEQKLAEKTADAIADQQKRINELINKIKDIDLSAIPSEFERSIEQAKENTDRQVREIQASIETLEVKEIKTDLDKIEIAKSKELIEAVKTAGKSAVDKLTEARQEQIKKAAQELEETRNEILKIITDINKTEIDLQINQADFDLQQATRTIKIDFESNVDGFKKQLEAGVITQEEYNDLITQNEIDKLDAIDKLYEGFNQEYIKKLDIRYKAELDIANKLKDSAKSKALTDLTKANREVELDFQAGTLTIEQALDKRILNHANYGLALEKIDQEYATTKQKLDNQLIESEQRVNDLGVDAHRAAEDAKTEYTINKNKEITEAQKRNLETLKDQAIGLFEDISGTLFEIENAQSERLFESQKSRLEKNYENQIKLAAGNTQEIARLEAEKAKKIEDLERQQAKKRKAQAIQEAIIAGALAIVKALPNFLLIPFIVAATALQIARIKAQSFAKGGKVKAYGGFTGGSYAPPDETGERPVDAQLHEGEYVSTRRQVNKNSWLYDILEADRTRVNAGASTDLEQRIAETIQARRRVVFNLQQDNKLKRFDPIIPVVIPLGGSGKQQAEFTDEQIERLADVMAHKIAQRSGEAIYSGTVEGSKNATKQALRFERTQQRKVV